MDCFAVAQSTFLEMLPVSPDLCKDLKLDREIFLFFRLSAAPRRRRVSKGNKDIVLLVYYGARGATELQAAQDDCGNRVAQPVTRLWENARAWLQATRSSVNILSA